MRIQIPLLPRYFVSSVGIFFVVFSCAVFALPALADEGGGVYPTTGVVTANILNVRARPGTHYEVVTQVECGDELQVVGENDEWLEVLAPSGSRAWVADRYIDEEGKITGDRVRVHSGPGLVFTTFHYLNTGDRVTLTGETVRGWQQIEPPAGATVWLSRAYIRVIVPEEEEEVVEETVGSSVEASGEFGVSSELEASERSEDEEAESLEESEGIESEAPEGSDTASDEIREDVITGKTVGVSETSPEEKEASEGEEELSKFDGVDDREREEAGREDGVITEEGTAEPETAVADDAEVSEQASEGDDAEDERAATRVRLEGLVLPLKDSGETDLTHVLGVRIGNTCFPRCFLRSDTIDLREWEWRRVGVYGKQFRPAGWEKSIIDVSSIQTRSSY